MSNTKPELSAEYVAARNKANAAADAQREALEARGDEDDQDAQVSKDWHAARRDYVDAQENFDKLVDKLPQNQNR